MVKYSLAIAISLTASVRAVAVGGASVVPQPRKWRCWMSRRDLLAQSEHARAMIARDSTPRVERALWARVLAEVDGYLGSAGPDDRAEQCTGQPVLFDVVDAPSDAPSPEAGSPAGHV